MEIVFYIMPFFRDLLLSARKGALPNRLMFAQYNSRLKNSFPLVLKR